MIYHRYNLIIRVGMVIIILLLISMILIMNNGGILEVFLTTKELPIYSVERNDKKISISFDAAWGDEFTNDILDTLDKYNVKSTFFLVGFWVDKYPHRVEEIHKRGHEIGNHSSTHPNMSQLSREQIIEELKVTEDKIISITNEKPILFRPPFGDYDDLLIKTAQELGYYTIQWDIDSLDWKELGVEPVIDKVVKNVTDGSIVLFHNNAKYIREYLPIIIERLQEKGYEIVPISELIYKDNFEMDNRGRQIYLK
ncbi:polysaccharide deacetylase family sporulation protein PdaB [Tissierella sp. Yu-01]|uniref:polysaccharide deacetylase family sporulation protein PdaB n=1 Tax=Tissierella sp. Yu-01 TaxID=3035694 RepID=UPI00240E5FCB|nr:polysaccharide deacetylase family sporulation protein PdaB [Tissierella sp. Yu-01]WFA09899.1 polysaccharide deacetylase family sporulation protein PdaB [Tissierella sp. Yu-01]